MKKIDLFSKIKNKNFDDSLTELLKIEQEENEIIYDILFLPLIRMNYLNYLYDLNNYKYQYNKLHKLFEFIQKLSKNKNKFPLIFITHLEYVLLKISNEDNVIYYCINLISFLNDYINKSNDKLDINNIFFNNNVFNINKNKISNYSNIFNCLFNNPNLSFESILKVYEEIIHIVGEEILKDSLFIEKINNVELLYFIIFYKKKILKQIPLTIQNINNNNNEEEIYNPYFNRIMLEFFQIGYSYAFIIRLCTKYKNNSLLQEFKNYLNSFINLNPYLTKKYKYSYSNETFQLINDYIFLNAKKGYFSQIGGVLNQKLFFEFIINNEQLCNYNLINPKESFCLEQILLSGKYDYSDYIIINWNTLFPVSIFQEKKYNKEKNEIDGDNTDSEEESYQEEEQGEIVDESFIIDLNSFIKSLLSLDYSKDSNNKLNCNKLFTFLESKMNIIIKYFSYSIIPNYYDMHKYLMKKNQPPSYYRFCITYIITKNIVINYKNILNPIKGKHNFMTKAFKPEMNIFIKKTINDLVYNYNQNFDYLNFLNEVKQRVCIYCLLLINIHDSIDNRLKDIDNFFNEFLYLLDPNIEKDLNPYKEVMIYYCNKLKIKPYNYTKINIKEKMKMVKESIIEKKKSYWLDFYKIMILIYIRKKYNDKFNPELLWEGLNNYYDIKGIFYLLINSSKNSEHQTIEILFEKELIPRFCIFINKGIYFNILNKIKDVEFIKYLADRRNEIDINDIGDLFIITLEKLLTNKILFEYLWKSFDNNYKINLIKQNIRIYIKAYLYYTFKRYHFFQNNMLE